jgi:hypothetical protein
MALDSRITCTQEKPIPSNSSTVAAAPRCIAARLPIAAREHIETLLVGPKEIGSANAPFPDPY